MEIYYNGMRRQINHAKLSKISRVKRKQKVPKHAGLQYLISQRNQNKHIDDWLKENYPTVWKRSVIE